MVATSFETVPPRSVLHRFRIPPDNFEFRHTSFLQVRSGYDSISIDTALKSNWNAITGSPHFGPVGSGFEQQLRSKMRNSQKAPELAFCSFDSFSANCGDEEPKRCRLIADRETFVEIETHETLLIVSRNPHFLIVA